MNLDRMRLSFNTGNMTGSIADKLAAIHGVGFGGTTMWPADFFVHFEDLDANLEHARTSPLACTCYMMVRDLEGSHRGQVEEARACPPDDGSDGADRGEDVVQCSNIGNEVDRNWPLAVEDLQKLGDLAKSRGMRIAFEPMSQGEWINTWQLGWQMVKDVDHAQVGLVSMHHTSSSLAPISMVSIRFPARRSSCARSRTSPTPISSGVRCCAITAYSRSKERGRSARLSSA